MSINFLCRPVATVATDMIGEERIVKTTKRLVFGKVDVFTAGEDVPIARVASTYVTPDAITESWKAVLEYHTYNLLIMIGKIKKFLLTRFSRVSIL